MRRQHRLDVKERALLEVEDADRGAAQILDAPERRARDQEMDEPPAIAGDQAQRAAGRGVLHHHFGRADVELERAVEQRRLLRGIAEDRALDREVLVGEEALLLGDPERHVEVGARNKTNREPVGHCTSSFREKPSPRICARPAN